MFKSRLKNKLKHAYAFTLAEVLITLAIIGVVAAITIPLVINKTQDLEFKSAFKKIYSQLDQITRQLLYDNNGSLAYPYNENYPATHKCGTYSWPGNANCFRDLYADNLKTLEKCDEQASGYMSAGVNCWTTESWNKPNGATGNPEEMYSANSGSGMVLINGATVNVIQYPYGGFPSVPVRGTVKIDVNGNKGPNVWGRDYFGAYITDKGLVPFGASGDWYNSAAFGQLCSQAGGACASDIILNK